LSRVVASTLTISVWPTRSQPSISSTTLLPICPLADSCIHTAKYAALESRYIFQPIAVEILGEINGSAVSFLSGLGRWIADVSGESREGSFLFQRLSVLIQRFNAVLLHDCFVGDVAGHSD